MTSLLSDINIVTEKHRGVKPNGFVIHFMLVKGRPTKVGTARFFGESGSSSVTVLKPYFGPTKERT